MKLTANQILIFDEFMADTKSVELTLKIALTYHSNRMNEIHKVERKLWDDLIEIHDLDDDCKYKLGSDEGCVQIIKVED